MGFEHERIHFETSSVLMRELPVHLLRQPSQFPNTFPTKSDPSLVPQCGADYPENRFIHVAAKTVTLGKHLDFPSYGWDNEYGSLQSRVRPFRASKCKITNGEFYEFVTAGSYRNEALWSSEGWKWRQFRNVKWPTFWAACGPQGANQFKLRTMFEMIDMQWDWPVIVNYYEAEAFCKWKSGVDGLSEGGPKYRVLTEAEHNVMRGNMGDSYDPVMVHDGSALVKVGEVNANLGYGSENSVLQYRANEMGKMLVILE